MEAILSWCNQPLEIPGLVFYKFSMQMISAELLHPAVILSQSTFPNLVWTLNLPFMGKLGENILLKSQMQRCLINAVGLEQKIKMGQVLAMLVCLHMQQA